MNLITRTIPVLILALSGLALSSTSQADSRFSVIFSSGYTAPHVSYAYYNSYRPYARPHRPPVHVDTYVEKHVYRDNGYYGRYRHEDEERYNEHRNYRRGGHHSRRHDDDNPARRRHTRYARTTHY